MWSTMPRSARSGRSSSAGRASSAGAEDLGLTGAQAGLAALGEGGFSFDEVAKNSRRRVDLGTSWLHLTVCRTVEYAQCALCGLCHVCCRV